MYVWKKEELWKIVWSTVNAGNNNYHSCCHKTVKQRLPLINHSRLWGFETLPVWHSFYTDLSRPVRIGCLMATGLKILAARWVDLGQRLWRACLHSLADVITSYQRVFSNCPVMTLLHRHHLAADWQGAWPRSSAEETHSCVFYDGIRVSWQHFAMRQSSWIKHYISQ